MASTPNSADRMLVNRRVLVTGADGYVGSHCVDLALRTGFKKIRCAVFSASAASVSSLVSCTARHGVTLELVQLDVLHDAGWAEACAGCTFVIHTAAPVEKYRSEEEAALSVRVAVEGTKRVLAAAKAAGVARVAMTSSVAATISRPANQPLYPCGGYEYDAAWDCEAHVATEADWTPEEKLCPGYLLAKTRSEREAWASVEGSATQLVTVNPTIIIGPPLNRHGVSLSVSILKAFFGHTTVDPQGHKGPAFFLGAPPMSLDLCDVRDVAAAHVRALLVPAAAGNRYLVVGHSRPVAEVMAILRKHYAPRGYSVPAFALRKWVLWLVCMLPLPAQVSVRTLCSVVAHFVTSRVHTSRFRAGSEERAVHAAAVGAAARDGKARARHSNLPTKASDLPARPRWIASFWHCRYDASKLTRQLGVAYTPLEVRGPAAPGLPLARAHRLHSAHHSAFACGAGEPGRFGRRAHRI